MLRIAVLGANGQVGAELCLLLSRIPQFELVPVCRNPTGSAFLRFNGIACRHGRIADSKEATALIGDCDVILNCALGAGTPRDIRVFDRTLLRNVFAYSPAGAIIIHCSTLMIHGDPRRGRLVRWRDAYGRAKLMAEKYVRRESRRSGKSAYTLRLGHVCGPFQNITHKIRTEMAAGNAVLFERDRPSNVVYTVTIVDAIRSILAGKVLPGEYDLTNSPQWSWRQVYEYESKIGNLIYSPRILSEAKNQRVPVKIASGARRLLARWSRSPLVRRTLDRWLAMAPAALNARAQATWYKLRARAEIAELTRRAAPPPEISWIDLSRDVLGSLQPTAHLLAMDPYSSLSAGDKKRWPRHLDGNITAPANSEAQASAV